MQQEGKIYLTEGALWLIVTEAFEEALLTGQFDHLLERPYDEEVNL